MILSIFPISLQPVNATYTYYFIVLQTCQEISVYNILSLLHELTHKQKYVMPTPKPAEDINKKEESRLVEITEEDEEEEEEEVEVEKAKEEEQNGEREEANVTKQENASKAGQLLS